MSEPISLSGNTTTKMMTNASLERSRAIMSDIYATREKVNSQSQYASKQELYDHGEYGDFTVLKEDISRSQEYQNNLQKALIQMNQTDVVLGNILDDVRQAKYFMTEARSPMGQDMAIDARIREHLEFLVSQLNYRFNDKALFAGYDTDILPVNPNTPYTSNLVYDTKNQIWVATSNYADGDQSAKIINTDDNNTVKYNLVASDPTFAKMIGAYHKILSNVQNPTALAQGYDELDAAYRELTETRADYGTRIKRLEDAASSWAQIEEDLTAVYHDSYGNNPAMMAGIFSDLQVKTDLQTQIISLIAMLNKDKLSILDKMF